MGQEHQPQNVIVLYIARGEGGRTLAIKNTWERICERHKDAKHVHLQDRGVSCVHLLHLLLPRLGGRLVLLKLILR